jgi:tRNA threonylcarbamoyladenosine biosynthesis protein TsaB
MNLIAIDSCSSVLSIAVSHGDEMFHAGTEAGMKHSELIMDCIDSLMKKVSLNPCDLNGVLCMGGPGSFTGLRIGFSVAKGLALSLFIPFVALPTLECIAFPCRGGGLTFAIIEARKNAWFFAVYHKEKLIIPATDACLDQIITEINKLETTDNEKIAITGYGAASLFEILPHELRKKIILRTEKRSYAGELIAIAKAKNLFDNNNETSVYSGPEYIRKTDAELMLEKTQVKDNHTD